MNARKLTVRERYLSLLAEIPDILYRVPLKHINHYLGADVTSLGYLAAVSYTHLVAGMGWLHYYVNGDGDQNSWSTRLGLNFNFNLGESKAWTLGIKPAIVYDMQGTYPETKSRFNANNAGFELTAGLTYHFKTSNGTHHFEMWIRDRRYTEFLGGETKYTSGTVHQLTETSNPIEREFYEFYRTQRGEFTPDGATPMTTTHPVSYTHLRISIISCRVLFFRINQNCPRIRTILMMKVQVPNDKGLFKLNT